MARPQQGVALVEALVALAVMAFGMLGLVGVQATLRQNADTARQRSESVRIAQEEVETWRAFALLNGPTGSISYNTLLSGSATPISGTNATYSVTRSVNAEAGYKVMTVDVDWSDRNAAAQKTRLSTAIAAVAPELAGTISVPPQASLARHPGSRAAGIPVQARDLGNGTSGFLPPQAGGGGVAWVFNNTTGVITVCHSLATSTDALTLANIDACGSNAGQLLSGFVRFAYNIAEPTAANAEFPTATALNLDVTIAITGTGYPVSPAFTCFDDAPTTAPTAQTAVRYYCVVFPNSDGKWSGTSMLIPYGLGAGSPWVVGNAAGTGIYRVCRYTTATIDNPPNPQHPYTYVDVNANDLMTNQNFLVIAGASACPSDVPADPSAGDFVNSNTRQQQPAPA